MNLTSGLRIARIRGIDIRIHWSWLIIFWLIIWGVAGLFGEFVASWSDTERYTAALIASLFFFLSIVLHELSHAFVAQSYGMTVPSITLFVLGGVASLAEEAKTAKQEFLVAFVGPMTSFTLAAIFGLVWLATRDNDWAVVPGYLGWINLALGAFNLLPGFPLDGGRVFRAIVWAFTDSRSRATRWAGIAGSSIAYLLIGFGVLNLALGSLGGLWYVVIGLFLRSASQGSEQATLIDELLEHVTVRDVMRPPPDPIAGTATLQDLVDTRVLVSGERCHLVGEDGAVIGIITTSDLTRVPRERWATTRVADAMIPEDRTVVIDPDAAVLDGLVQMQQHDVHQLPVVQDGHLVGLLTRGDVMRQIELRQRFAPASRGR